MPRFTTARLRRPARADNSGVLTGLTAPFANPGGLRMRTFLPPDLAPGAPLVVVLHGCTQTASAYDSGAGWSALASALGFALLFPEQTQANNANVCFNWFEPGDTRRGVGEAASIANAVAAMVAAHGLDPARVFVTGLSAGGAMTNVMLAAYPDVFAGGAIIAGLAYRVADGVAEALQTMARPAPVAPRLLGDRVRAASSFAGPWPVVSVWHGGSDRTVAVANGEAIAAQWADVHHASSATGDADHRVWRNAAGVVVVEFRRIPGMGHGTPIDASAEGNNPAPFMLDVGIASSAAIAAFWGLGAAPAQRSRPPTEAPLDGSAPPPPLPLRGGAPAGGRFDVARLIDDTLRSAGLMK